MPGLYDLYDLYDLARAAEWEPYSLHDLLIGHASLDRSLLDRSWTTQHERLVRINIQIISVVMCLTCAIFPTI